MASSVRVPTIRHLLRQPLPNPQLCQRRWAQVHNVRRFVSTDAVQQRILAKYRDKLESKAREEGLQDVSQLKEVYKEKIERLRKEAAVPGATAPLTPPPSSSSPSPTSTPASSSPPPASKTQSPWPAPPPPPSPNAAPKPPPGVKTLNSFLDMSKISALPQKEIEVLWRLRHASNPQSVHFHMPSTTFNTLLTTAKKHPTFVVPLPKQVPAEETTSSEAPKQAAELHYLQFGHPHPDTTTLLFTSLAEFKLRGEFASPHTTITFHSELAGSHGLVLGQGTVMENRGVTVDEARWLVMCMQKFYVVGEEGKGRGELLEMFTRGDGGFKVERLLEEAEKLV
ncbi:ATP11-domain-containing protein [Westerdykella ornata]|uniref:ATP11-domain-containing protein n=1 Tax=Westerdykella ornata TaxID=318751 RepID=A0A6A6JYI3_WESOR|nr:ATP11-domain-containing protein [Westerdykella ornata]KAF2280816.1 ATP11-domain-containing protein [Westerdykella ornata]